MVVKFGVHSIRHFNNVVHSSDSEIIVPGLILIDWAACTDTQ